MLSFARPQKEMDFYVLLQREREEGCDLFFLTSSHILSVTSRCAGLSRHTSNRFRKASEGYHLKMNQVQCACGFECASKNMARHRANCKASYVIGLLKGEISEGQNSIKELRFESRKPKSVLILMALAYFISRKSKEKGRAVGGMAGASTGF